MHIESPEGDLVACLQSKVTCIFFDTWTPYHCDLETLYHVVLKSPYHWVPQNVKLPEFASYVQEEVEIRSVASEASLQSNYTFECFYCGDCRELYGFCEIEGLLQDTPVEDDVLNNVGEVSHINIESIRVTEK